MSKRVRAFEEGKRAYSRSVLLSDNPYTHETSIQSENNRAWTQGWRTAAAADPLLDPDEREVLLSEEDFDGYPVRPAAKALTDPGWVCAGCGKPSPHRVEVCDCPTQVVIAGNQSAWKRSRGEQDDAARCYKLIGKLYEKPKLPGMDTKDINLIKAALAAYARR